MLSLQENDSWAPSFPHWGHETNLGSLETRPGLPYGKEGGSIKEEEKHKSLPLVSHLMLQPKLAECQQGGCQSPAWLGVRVGSQ